MTTVAHSRIFQSGNSQAVRLPKSVAFPNDVTEVLVEKDASGALIIKPVKRFDWDAFFDLVEAEAIDMAAPEDDLPDTERQDQLTHQLNEGL